MTKFLDKSFSVPMGGNQQYRDNWEATFGKKTAEMPGADERAAVVAWLRSQARGVRKVPGVRGEHEASALLIASDCVARGAHLVGATPSSSKEQKPEPTKEPEPECEFCRNGTCPFWDEPTLDHEPPR